MTRNGELREELKTLQVEKKQFLHVQSRLEKVCSLNISRFLNLHFAAVTSYQHVATWRIPRRRCQNDASILLLVNRLEIPGNNG